MTATLPNPVYSPASKASQHDNRLSALLDGEILLKTQSHTDWGAAVTARMYLPIEQTIAWQRVTEYSKWINYFPAITQSEVLHTEEVGNGQVNRRLYQAASKNFLVFTAQVDIRLKVVETNSQRAKFYLESGMFKDFYADLHLQEWDGGTMLTYYVQATPTIPVPSIFIQQAIQLDLPANLKNMRQQMLSNGL